MCQKDRRSKDLGAPHLGDVGGVVRYARQHGRKDGGRQWHQCLSRKPHEARQPPQRQRARPAVCVRMKVQPEVQVLRG